MKSPITHAVLVYQVGIANVFKVDRHGAFPTDRNAKRVLQGDFRTCQAFARGLAAAGVSVTSAYCTEAGDITNSVWHTDLENAPFFDMMYPVYGGDV